MDIIDVMLAKALTPQGQTEIYVNKANQAAAKAEKAKTDAETAIATVEAASDEITAAQEEATELLAAAQEALETAQSAQINTLSLEDVNDEIKQLGLNISVDETASVNTLNLVTTYPDDTTDSDTITKLYKLTGSNEDGTMTQKAITQALADKADTSALAAKADTSTLDSYATKQYVDTQISNIPSSGSSASSNINFNVDDAGHIVVVDDEGHPISGALTEDNLINALLDMNSYIAKDAVGLEMNYADKLFTRIQQATGKAAGEDFNAYTMYGGRTKCNVADNGTITAFYGDQNYIEDGSNGQVMIYQPKFYYRRIPHSFEETSQGKIVRHESLIISATEQPGFKLAPIFTGNLDYVLLPAYDGSLYNGQLCSVAGAAPMINVTIEQAEIYAKARGAGWHIMNLAAESANQMLEIVEFGMMNGQTALESGIVNNPAGTGTCLFITGSTAALGNGTGHATTTQVSINGNVSSQTESGYRAIAYRGMENPWGNVWQMIGGVIIKGFGQDNGGIPYICTDFNYSGSNYESIGFGLPSHYKWVNAMGLGIPKYDWAFLPIECSDTANSLLPIGDSIWVINGSNIDTTLATGGSYGFREECGPFYYAADRAVADTARPNYGAKLLYIPTKNAIYEANIAKWNTYMGG